MTITHNGITLTHLEWAAKTGLKPHTIETRISRGWDIKRTLETPQTRPPSKNDAEMYLNDLTFEHLPKKFQKIVLERNFGAVKGRSCKAKYGQFLRNSFRSEFDKWFASEYLPQHKE